MKEILGYDGNRVCIFTLVSDNAGFCQSFCVRYSYAYSDLPAMISRKDEGRLE